MHSTLSLSRCGLLFAFLMGSTVAANLFAANGHNSPATDDLWDMSRGVQVTHTSGVRPEFDVRDMLGGEYGVDWPGQTIFADGNPPGFVHFVEWRTVTPVVVARIDLYAEGDGAAHAHQREFERFILRAKSAGSVDFDLVIVDYTPVHPYEWIDAETRLLLRANVDAFSAQGFRAEFIQRDAGRGYDGPRVYELDAFGPECIGLPAGLAAWWRAEGSGADDIGGWLGVLHNDAGFAPGRVGQAFDLTAADSHVRVSGFDAAPFAGALTVEAWVHPIAASGVREIVSKWDAILGPSQSSFTLGVGTDGIPFFAVSPSGIPMDLEAVYAHGAPLAPGTWSHVAGVYDGETLRIHVNGQLVNQELYNQGVFTGTSDLGIGGVVGGTPPGSALSAFGGLIDEVSLYSRALSAMELQDIYAGGAAGKCVEISCDLLGMVTWWRGQGDATDAHGPHDGILVNGVTFEPGKVGSAFRFDGIDGRIRIPASPELDLSTAPGFTFEAWLRPDSVDTTMVVAEWHDIVEQRLGVHLALNVAWPTESSPKLSLFANLLDTHDNFHIIASEAGLLTAQEWSHVALTRDADGDLVRLFLDGVIVAERAVPFGGTGPRTEGDFWLGDRAVLSQWDVQLYPYMGLIDEVSLYDRALAPGEILAIYQAGGLGKCAAKPSGVPLARWAFDETSGSVAHDSAGSSHGTLSMAGAGFVEGGIRGNALRLDRSLGGYVSMGSQLELGDLFTLMAWVKTEPNDTTDSAVVLSRHAAGSANGYYLSLNRSGFLGQPGRAMFVASDAAGQEVVSTSVVNDGEWHQLVAVYEGGVGKRLYVDGQPVEAQGPAAVIVANTAPFLVGGISVGGAPEGFFTGWIDEVRVYDRALADNEVEYLYRNPEALMIPEALEPRMVMGLQNQTVTRGAVVELAVTVEGDSPLSYVWSKDGVELEGAEGSVLTLEGVLPGDGGVYGVVVSNQWGTASSSAMLRVLWPPTITVAPAGQSVSLGESGTLSVTAEGAAPLAYQWLHNNQPVLGATSRFLLLDNVTPMSAGNYQVQVSNSDGVVTTDPVWVHIYSGLLTAVPVSEGLRLEVRGLQPGRNYLLERAASLPAGATAWEPLLTVLNAGESFQFVDPDAASAARQYYRVRLLP